MREIKFRAWIRDGEWEEDGSEQKYIMCYDLGFEDYEPLNDLLAGVENLMQYTGLKDKNGKEIYEGDIVNTRLPGMVEHITGGVSIEPSRGVVVSFLPIGFDIEVIGNIYENPEILKPLKHYKGEKE